MTKNGKKNGSIFSLDKFILVLHITDGHWSAGCINFKQKLIEYYDSMFKKYIGRIFFNIIKKYMEDEYNNQKPKDYALNLDEWECKAFEKEYPQQPNGYDCGVYTLKCVELISNDVFPDKEKFGCISEIRKKILLSLMQGKIVQ